MVAKGANKETTGIQRAPKKPRSTRIGILENSREMSVKVVDPLLTLASPPLPLLSTLFDNLFIKRHFC
jgi:hypothetical protein